MKRTSLIFLQTLIILIGIATFVFLLWEPHLEGRNVGATLFEIYFTDLFLACAYATSLLFFTVLYQTFKLLEYGKQGKLISQESTRALRTIRYCALLLASIVVVGEVYLFIAVRGTDDIAGGVAMGLFFILVSIAIATAAAVFEKRIAK